MREAFRGLTVRGKSLLAAGMAVALLSVFLGEKDLFRVAALVTVLPLVSVLVLSRTRYQVSTARVLDPGRVEAGQQAQVKLRLRNLSRVPTGSMMLEDKLPFALGTRPRLVLERLVAGSGSAVSYTVRAETRGHYELGPLLVRLTDPFGLVEIARTYPAVDKLIVTPSITPLPPIRIPGDYAGNGEHRSRAVAVHGEDDAAIREYRHGDDLRRVHWGATAHSGELMVRREEQPWDSRATVLLDLRAGAYRGEGPTGSFEWAVAATASITTHLRRSGYKTRLVTQTTEAEPELGNDAMLDYLSGVQVLKNGDVNAMVENARKREYGGLIIAVLGSLNTVEAERLAVLHSSGATCVAMLVDSTSWLRLNTSARQHADRDMHNASITLLRSGWRVLPVSHGTALAPLWRSLSQGQLSSPATMADTVSKGPR